MKENNMKENKISLLFIVNGAEFLSEANIHEPLKAEVSQVLAKSNNGSKPIDEWEVHDEAGKLLDLNKKVGELNLSNNARLFLNLGVGAGGV